VSKGGSVKEQLKALHKQIEEEEKIWVENQIPHVGAIYSIGEGQFQMEVRVQAYFEIFRDVLEIDMDQLELVYKRVLLQKLREVREAYKAAKSEAARRSLLDGVMFKPPDMN
jgi:hypothetical protein